MDKWMISDRDIWEEAWNDVPAFGDVLSRTVETNEDEHFEKTHEIYSTGVEWISIIAWLPDGSHRNVSSQNYLFPDGFLPDGWNNMHGVKK